MRKSFVLEVVEKYKDTSEMGNRPERYKAQEGELERQDRQRIRLKSEPGLSKN